MDRITVGLSLACVGFMARPSVAQDGSVKVVAPPAVRFFDVREVQLLPGPFLDARARDEATLLAIDPDRLLHTFRINAGLPSAAVPYGGWEAPDVELRGHSLGHYLTACSRMFAATGDERFKQRTDLIVIELERVQAALQKSGSNAGYVSAFPESFIDRVEARTSVWAPYYTLHKIMAGLLDAHAYASNDRALTVLIGMADWVGARMQRLTREQQQQMLQTEFGGMNEVLARLALTTGEPRYLRLARMFDHDAVFGPLERGVDSLDGLHGNTQIPKMIGAMVEYELSGEDRYRQIARFFWERVARTRSFVIGGNTNDEHFFPVSQFSHNRGSASTETCNSYNMIRLSAALFEHEPSAGTMDFVERALFNHILASQDPATGMVCYYVPMRSGAYKTFSTPDSSFWCCVGTGMENPVRTVETIYARDLRTLYVNLFIPSEVTWRDRGIVVRQETRFPEEGRTRLTLRMSAAQRFRLALRHPGWAGNGFHVSINGRVDRLASSPGTFAVVERMWNDGDVVEVTLPMHLAMERMPDDSNVVAFLHGPIVLAGDLGREGLDEVREYGPYAPQMRKVRPIDVPAFVVSDRENVLERIRPSPDTPGAFRTEGLGRPNDVTLVPFAHLFHRRYAVYWDLWSPEQWERTISIERGHANRRAEVLRRTIDAVDLEDRAAEKAHGYRGERAGEHWFDDRRGREARDGWFRYTVAAGSADSLTLVCTYRGSDGRPRAFDVLVDDVVIAAERFDNQPPGFFDREYSISRGVTHGKDSIAVTFRAAKDATAGPVFELRVIR